MSHPVPFRFSHLLGLASLAMILIFTLYIRSLRPIAVPHNSTGILRTPTVRTDDPQQGSDTADITLVEYGDFLCEPCAQMAQTLREVTTADPGIRVVWKDFPNESLHPTSTLASVAAHCAARQGIFWQYHDMLFQSSGPFTTEQLITLARPLLKNERSFVNCLQAQETLSKVTQNKQEGLNLFVTATPTLFIGEERLVGVQSAADILSLIRQTRANTPSSL